MSAPLAHAVRQDSGRALHSRLLSTHRRFQCCVRQPSGPGAARCGPQRLLHVLLLTPEQHATVSAWLADPRAQPEQLEDVRGVHGRDDGTGYVSVGDDVAHVQ